MEEGCVHAEDADPQPAPTQLEGLTDELLRCILASNLALEDLAHVGRINRRFRGLVYTTEDAWRQLYCQMFTAKQQGRGKSTNNDTWRALFQAQYIQNAKDLRLKRKVRVLKLQSSVDTSRRELLAMTADLRKERALCANVGIQIQELKRARLAKVASQAWQPQAVQLHYNQVLQATPVDSQWRLTALEQELKVSQLRISSIENSMAIRRSQLRRDEPQLRALTSS